MKNLSIAGYFILILSLVFLTSGCQATTKTEETSEIHKDLPYSRGPISTPSVKGPDASLPGQTQDFPQMPDVSTQEQPQAVTETETVRYTLPESQTSEFKH